VCVDLKKLLFVSYFLCGVVAAGHFTSTTECDESRDPSDCAAGQVFGSLGTLFTWPLYVSHEAWEHVLQEQ